MKGVKNRPQRVLAQQRLSVTTHLCSFRVFGNLLRDFHMLTVFGAGSDVLLVTRTAVFRRNQAEESFERGVVPFEGLLQFRRRDHFVSMVELRKMK